MAKVYLSKEIEKIIDKMDFSKLGEKVGIKVHFGERGCVTYTNPEIVKKVYDRLISLGKGAALVECNVLYRGSRTIKQEHIKVAKEHGFGFAPIDILDGEKGEEFIEVEGAKLGKGIEKYDSLIILTHFKGHITAGFGGAFKNMGMGFGSRAGKLDMHSNLTPFVNKNACVGCSECIKNCNANAISLVNEKAEIDKGKCEGCTMCIAVCPQSAISLPWGEEKEGELDKRIVNYGKSVINLFKDKIIYINILENITKDCDCFGIVQKPIIEDIGILLSEDPVAIDKASYDLVNEKSENKFQQISNANDLQTEYASELSLGEKEYEMEKLD